MINCPALFRVLCLPALILFTSVSSAQRMTPEEYISRYQDAAVEDMKKMGVPASITLAQGMYESDYGNSPLAKEANNHFGIKCHKEWNGPTYVQDGDAADECFRKYEKVQQSYDDHSDFLRTRERYSFLFQLDITDYKGWAHGLKRAGYATNPAYAGKLIELIERYNLNELDKGATKVPLPVYASSGKEVPEQKQKETVKENNPKNTVSTPAPTQKSLPILTSSNTINDVPFVRAGKGDSWLKIATDNNLELWEILEYNEADKNRSLRENDIVYLKPKKQRCEQTYHVVQKGENIYIISQLYGVRMSKLYQRNHLHAGTEPVAGTKLYLRMNKSFYE